MNIYAKNSIKNISKKISRNCKGYYTKMKMLLNQKYYAILEYISFGLDSKYKLTPPSEMCWHVDFQPIYQMLAIDRKKTQDAFFSDFVYMIFCEKNPYSPLIKMPRAPLYNRKKGKEKEFFWEIIGDRKEEFLRNCAEFKARKKIKRNRN